MQFHLSLNAPRLLTRSIASPISACTCRLQHRKFAHVGGVPACAYAHPYSPVTLLCGDEMRRNRKSHCASPNVGRGRSHNRTSRYTKSRSSRGSWRKVTMAFRCSPWLLPCTLGSRVVRGCTTRQGSGTGNPGTLRLSATSCRRPGSRSQKRRRGICRYKLLLGLPFCPRTRNVSCVRSHLRLRFQICG